MIDGICNHFLVVPILAKINKSVNYNLAGFFKIWTFDVIDYCGLFTIQITVHVGFVFLYCSCLIAFLCVSLCPSLFSFLFNSGNNEWEFHFHEVIVIATVVYIYTWCLPVILWLFLVWRNVSDRYSLIKMQSIYGYSMAIFIPLTVSITNYCYQTRHVVH